MSTFKSYRDLEVWQRAMVLAKDVYTTTARFPGEEKFGLVNQMRRAAVSIVSNVAEGHARSTTSEFQRLILIAMGSVAELETQALLSQQLGHVADQHATSILSQLDSIGKMLRALHRSLASRKLRNPSLWPPVSSLVAHIRIPRQTPARKRNSHVAPSTVT